MRVPPDLSRFLDTGHPHRIFFFLLLKFAHAVKTQNNSGYPDYDRGLLSTRCVGLGAR